MEKFRKFVLVATSLAPILGTYAALAWDAKHRTAATIFGVLALTLTLFCWYMVRWCHRNLSTICLTTAKVKPADKEVLSFLLVYILPTFAGSFAISGDAVTPFYAIAIISLCVYHSNAFTFNPIMAIMGYHFYEIEIENGMNGMLISKGDIRKNKGVFKVREIAIYIYLNDDNAESLECHSGIQV